MYTTISILYIILGGSFLSLALLVLTIVFVPSLEKIVSVMIMTFCSLALGFHAFRLLCRFFGEFMIVKFVLNTILNLSMIEYVLLVIGFTWISSNVVQKYVKEEERYQRQRRREERVITFIHSD